MSELLFNELPRPTFRWLRVNHTVSSLAGEDAAVQSIAVEANKNILSPLPAGTALLDGNYEGANKEAVQVLVEKAEGYAINVPAKAKEVVGIRIDANARVANRFQFIVGEGAELEVQFYVTGSGDTLTNVSYLNEYDVKETGKVVVKKVNLLPEHVQHIEHRYTKLEDKADVEYINIEIGGSENILNYYHDLVGQESRVVHDIAYLGNKEQKFDISMVMSHGGKKSFSDIHTLGALSGNSKKSFRGTLDFLHGATAAEGAEEDTCLLLDSTVKSISLPLLLCKEDNVVGNHAASAGQIDHNKLFYIMSRGFNGNPHRGSHILAIEASEDYENARDRVVEFINAREREEVVFTRNSTESMNLIAHSYGLHNVKKGDKIVITVAEHHANLVTWQYVAEQTGATLDYMYLDEHGHLKDGEIDKIDESTKIVAFAHVSNVLGMEFPVKELTEKAHSVGAIVVLDGAQSTPHKKIDVQELDCDFFVFSGHKMCASQGIGVLYGKRELLEAMPPFLLGGDMIEYVKEQTATFNELPYKFEAGTPNADGAVSLHAAIDYLESFGMDAIEAYEEELVAYILPKIVALPHVHVIGSQNPKEKHGVIAFTVDDVHPHDVATILDSKGICVRSGHHCAQPLGAFYNVSASTRLSMYLYTRKEDLDAFLEVLKTVRSVMGFKD